MPDIWPTSGGLQPRSSLANPAQVNGLVPAQYPGTTSAANTMSRWVPLNYHSADTVTYDAHTEAPLSTTSANLTWSHTVGSGTHRLLLVAVSGEDTNTTTVSSVTYNGIPLKQIRRQAETSEATKIWVEVWGLSEIKMPATGTYDISVTTAAAPTGGSIMAAATSFSGAVITWDTGNNSAVDINYPTTFTLGTLGTYANNAITYEVTAGGGAATEVSDQPMYYLAAGGITRSNKSSRGVKNVDTAIIAASSSSQISKTITSDIPTETLMVVVVGADNSNTSGTSSITTISDSKGHTWTEQVNQNRTAASAANDGCSMKVFTAMCNTKLVKNTDSITVNFSPNVDNASMLIQYVYGTNGTISSITQNSGNAASPTGLTTTPTNGDDFVFGCNVVERTTAGSRDNDTLWGLWSAQYNTSDVSAGVHAASQWKLVTGVTTQTYSPTYGSTQDSCRAVFSIAGAGATSSLTVGTNAIAVASSSFTHNWSAGATNPTQPRWAGIAICLEGATNYLSEDIDGFWINFESTTQAVRAQMLHDIGRGIGSGAVTPILEAIPYTTGQILHPISPDSGASATYAHHRATVGFFPIAVPKNEQLYVRAQASNASSASGYSVRLFPFNGRAESSAIVDSLGSSYGTGSKNTELSATAANVYGAWTQLIASTTAPYYAVMPLWIPVHNAADFDQGDRGATVLIALGTGTAGNETEIMFWRWNYMGNAPFGMPFTPVNIPAGTRVCLRLQTSSADNPTKVGAILYALRGA